MPAPIGVKLPALLLSQIYANTFARAVATLPKNYAYVEERGKQEYSTSLSLPVPFGINQLLQTVLDNGKQIRFGMASQFDWKDRRVTEICRVKDGIVDYKAQLQTFVVFSAKERAAMSWRQQMDLAERRTPLVKNTYTWNVKCATGEGEPLLLKSEGVPAELTAQWEIVTKALAPLA